MLIWILLKIIIQKPLLSFVFDFGMIFERFTDMAKRLNFILIKTFNQMGNYLSTFFLLLSNKLQAFWVWLLSCLGLGIHSKQQKWVFSKKIVRNANELILHFWQKAAHFLIQQWQNTVIQSHKWLLYSMLTALLGILSQASFAQSLQWSQFTAPTPADATGPSATYAIEKAPNGAIYTLSMSRTGITGAVPTFRTSDVQSYGNPGGHLNATYTFLSKYAADGATLEWVRMIATETVGSSNHVIPYDLGIGASGEAIVTVITNNPIPGIITAGAWQTTPPPFNQASVAFNTALVLAKFSPTGTLTYGTYVGAAGGDLKVAEQLPNSGTYHQTPQGLKIGSDGTMYLSFTSLKLTGQTGVIPTTASAYQTDFLAGSTRTNNLLGSPINVMLSFLGYNDK